MKEGTIYILEQEDPSYSLALVHLNENRTVGENMFAVNEYPCI